MAHPLKPRIINANCLALSPALVMAAQQGLDDEKNRPTNAAAHPAQIMSWEMCAVAANAVEFNPEEFPDLKTKLTLGGLPLKRDLTLPEGWVEFRNDNGETVARIENLAIPIAWLT